MMDRGASYRQTPVGAFVAERRKAKRRGIPWRLTLPDWWSIWTGPRAGYVRGRTGDDGPGTPLGYWNENPDDDDDADDFFTRKPPRHFKRYGDRFVISRRGNAGAYELGNVFVAAVADTSGRSQRSRSRRQLRRLPAERPPEVPPWERTPHPRSAATRAKIAAALRGRTMSDATRRKISASKRGRRHTPETKAKISAAQRRRHARKAATEPDSGC